MKKVCIYQGSPRLAKPFLDTLKEKGIPYTLKTKFTIRAIHDYGTTYTRDALQGTARKDYIGPVEDIRIMIRAEDEQEARRLREEFSLPAPGN